MKTKKLQSIIVLILIISFAWITYHTSLEQIRFSDENYSYLGDLTWHRSLDKGFEIAQQDNKPIAVYFWAIWCQYCAGFQAKTLGNPQVKKILEEDYVLVAMDLDVDRNVASKYGVRYPPYVLFLDRNDNVINRIEGSVDAGTFLPIVTQVRDQVRGK
jgi:thioredoxin-related protein